MESLYIIFFSIWFLATILWQFEHVRKRSMFLHRMNIFSIFPIWTFFAPNPGITDTHLLYRDKLEGGDITDWEEISAFEKRKFYHFLWNPYKRKSKLVVDALSEVKVIKNNGESKEIENNVLQNQIKFSKGYLILLNMVVRNPKIKTTSTSRQFIVVDAYHVAGQREITPLFSSPFHTL